MTRSPDLDMLRTGAAKRYRNTFNQMVEVGTMDARTALSLTIGLAHIEAEAWMNGWNLGRGKVTQHED